jgi:hypothetical protein
MTLISRRLRRCLIPLLLLVPAATLQAQDFSSLEERMSAAEFEAAGLDKLSPEELAALNAWLRAKTLGSSASPSAYVPPAEDRRGLPLDSGDSSDPIVSRVVGEFKGWSGSGDRFELENGQVWETTDPASRLAVKLTDPIVTITPGVFNAWFLKVEGYSSRVRVKRVR